jgi:hypothetical protein
LAIASCAIVLLFFFSYIAQNEKALFDENEQGFNYTGRLGRTIFKPLFTGFKKSGHVINKSHNNQLKVLKHIFPSIAANSQNLRHMPGLKRARSRVAT